MSWNQITIWNAPQNRPDVFRKLLLWSAVSLCLSACANAQPYKPERNGKLGVVMPLNSNDKTYSKQCQIAVAVAKSVPGLFVDPNLRGDNGDIIDCGDALRASNIKIKPYSERDADEIFNLLSAPTFAENGDASIDLITIGGAHRSSKTFRLKYVGGEWVLSGPTVSNYAS
jgi:hypothetical protein